MIPGIIASGASSGGTPPVSAPVWLGVVGNLDTGSTQTSHAVSMPTTVNSGDLLVCCFCNDGGTTTATIPSGWTLLATSSTPNITAARSTWAYKVATGTEGGTTVTFTTSGAERSSAQVIRIQAGTYSGAPQIASNSGSSSTTPAPPTLSIGGSPKSYLWLVWMGKDNKDSTEPSFPYPSGNLYTAVGSRNSNTVSTACCYTTSVASSLSPGVFTTANADEWMCATIAIAPL
jgi:hypothetical protein